MDEENHQDKGEEEIEEEKKIKITVNPIYAARQNIFVTYLLTLTLY